MLKNCPDVLTVQEVATIMHVSLRSVYSLLRQGEMHHKKVGRIYRIPKCAIIEYLQKN